MKTSIVRLLTGAFALALLLAVGLSVQDTAQAQTATVDIYSGIETGDTGVKISFIRSCDPYPARTGTADSDALGTPAGTKCPADAAGDSQFTVTAGTTQPSAETPLEVYNTSLPKSGTGTGANDNPRKLSGAASFTLYAVPRTTNLRANEIKAFSGNVIEISYTPAGTLGVIKTLTVDNVAPTLVVTSPAHNATVKGGASVTFSAEFTDGASGFQAKAENLQAGTAGQVPDEGPDIGRGQAQLVVAGNIVGLVKGDFTAIDGGWRVSKTLNSTILQAVSANIPWYFRAEDNAGNLARTNTSIALAAQGGTSPTVITDARFGGAGVGSTLAATAFDGSEIKATRGSASQTREVTLFDNNSDDTTSTGGELTVASAFFTDNADTSPLNESLLTKDDKLALLGTSLLIVDSKAPTLGTITTGVGLSAGKEAMNRKNAIKVEFGDSGKTDSDTGSGLDPASATPAAFTVEGHTVSSVAVKGNNAYLTLADNLGSTEKPQVTVANGAIMDKAGNAYGGGGKKAEDGLGPNLSLSEDKDLSKSSVTVTISSDELLNGIPTVTLGRVVNADGGVINFGEMECVYEAVPASGTGDNALPALPKVTQATNADGSCEDPQAADGLDARYGSAAPGASPVPGQPGAVPNVLQSTAQSYTYTVGTTAIPTGTNGGKYTVYAMGHDTQGTTGGNSSTVGDKTNANNTGAFTFQLDRELNNAVAPIVTVSNAEDVGAEDKPPEVEVISPMIVTVNYAGEGKEYDGDTYRTVTLTSAALKVTFADGTSESTTFDLATQVSSSDNMKFTIPLLDPKVGSYSLTVKAEDSAGNTVTDGHTVTWKVIAATPFNVGLKPGWNLISLPFQPANPAINSVIPKDHAISLVMTLDKAEGVWLFSRRDAETSLFSGDVAVITASSAYFVRTHTFDPLKLLRPPVATAAAAPARPPAITVTEGFNLIPVSSNAGSVPKGMDADTYFGTLGSTWLQAQSWNPLSRSWNVVSPGQTVHTFANEDTGADFTDRCGRSHKFEKNAKVKAQVCTGEGMWLWVNKDGTLIPR